MAKVIVEGKVARLIRRKRDQAHVDGFILMIDNRAPLHVAMADFGDTPPQVGERISVKCKVDDLHAALFQAFKRLRGKSDAAGPRTTSEGLPVMRQRPLPSADAGPPKPVTRQKPLPPELARMLNPELPNDGDEPKAQND